MLKLSHLFGPKTKPANLAPTEATVLFCDIADFTRISSTHTPQEIIDSLENLFSRFDRRAEKEGILKVKTIGDSYMAALSSPLPRPEQIYRIIKFATGLYDDIAAYNQTASIKYHIRIGINSGEVIADFDNRSHLIYDLWGDTVNVAHRMECASKEGFITVTEAIKNSADQRIVFDHPQKRRIKGKGLMTIYAAHLK